MESAPCAVFLLAFFFVPCCYAQGDITETTAGSKTLEPWLVGLTAVMCFLFVIFVANLVNRVFCFKKTTEESPESGLQLRTTPIAYDNVAMQMEEESSKTAEPMVQDDKQTQM